MTIDEFLSNQAPDRVEVLTALHDTIMKTNKKLAANVSKMMGKDMIIYTAGKHFIYALGSGKNHMSLHAMPIYADKAIHEKYAKLMPKANFQKGCINFKDAEEMPPAVVRQFFSDCAKVDMAALMEKFKKK